MRYIDADKLKETWYTKHNITEEDRGACFVGYSEVPRFIDNAPTADVRENIKGEWIDAPNREFCFRADFKTIKCNKCGYNMPKCDSFVNNFCPNCGADMRGES